MRRVGKTLGILLGGAFGAAAADPPTRAMPAPQSMAAPAPRANLADVVQPEFRDAVAKVVRNPTITTKATGEEVVCTVEVYEWLYDHPDRVALAWQRLKVPAITIADLGGGK